MFTQLSLDRIHVEEATGDAGMLIVKKTLVSAEEFNSAVVHSRDTKTFAGLLHHLDGDINKNVIMETKKGCVSTRKTVLTLFQWCMDLET